MDLPHRTSIFASIVISSLSAASFAADFWQPLGGPYGGDIVGFGAIPAGVAVATSDGGVYLSLDDGALWSPIHLGAWNSGFAASPQGDLYLAANDRFLVSHDAGATWLPLTQPTSGVGSIAFDSHGAILVSAGGGVQRSEDGGATWTSLYSDVATSLCVGPGDVLLFSDQELHAQRSSDGGATWHPVAPNATYITGFAASARGDLFLGSTAGCWRSLDAGATWFLAGLTAPVWAIAIDSQSRVFAATDVGVFRSESGLGDDWVVGGYGLTDRNVHILHAGTGAHLFAGTQGHGVFRSDDLGENWVEMNRGLAGVNIHRLAFDGAGTLFAVSQFFGIWRTSDLGTTWRESFTQGGEDLAPQSDGRLLLATLAGVYRTSDHGQTWRPLGLSYQAVTAVAEASPDTLVAGTGFDGAYRSTDDGRTWAPSDSGLGQAYIFCLLRAPSGVLFAGTRDTGVFASQDHGATWTARGLAGESVWSMAADSQQRLFAVTLSGLQRSADGGASWDLITTLPGRVSTVEVGPFDRVWVGVQGAVYESADAGETWDEHHDGFVGDFVSTLVFDAAGFVYAAGNGGGVYRSTQPVTAVEIVELSANQDGADVVLQWRAPAAESEDFVAMRSYEGGLYVVVGARVEQRGRDAYVLRDRDLHPGDYRYRIAPAGEGDSGPSAAQVAIRVQSLARFASYLGPNLPNPFSPRTALEVGVGRAGHVEVTVYDARGRAIRSLWRAHVEGAGTHRVEWDGRDDHGRTVSQGLYFARLRVAGRVVATRAMSLVR